MASDDLEVVSEGFRAGWDAAMASEFVRGLVEKLIAYEAGDNKMVIAERARLRAILAAPGRDDAELLGDIVADLRRDGAK